MSDFLIGSIISIVSIIIGAILTYLVRPRVREKFKLREIYLAPFRKWCYKLYGELDEFNRRYLSKKKECLEYPSIQIIDDYRMLHESLVDAPRWTGKIEKECETISDSLKELIDTVDEFWHELEGQYNLQLKDRMDIIPMPKRNQREIAKKICKHIRETDYSNIQGIITYLKAEKIP